jgi:predicted amidophosphoribosyltransferase
LSTRAVLGYESFERGKYMRCQSCGSDNPEGVKFCIECAAPFKSRCPNCGFENPSRAKFCGECATLLTEGEKGKQITTDVARDNVRIVTAYEPDTAEWDEGLKIRRKVQ